MDVLLRAWNPTIKDHFYTANAAEMNNAVSSLGYQREKSPGRVFHAAVSGTVPLYRAWNQDITDHFYTTNKAEMDKAVSSLGYKAEGITGYLYSGPRQGCSNFVPLYRTWSPSATDHFYTSNKTERDVAISRFGYQDEGITGYIFVART
jgi:hypothetical protein